MSTLIWSLSRFSADFLYFTTPFLTLSSKLLSVLMCVDVIVFFKRWFQIVWWYIFFVFLTHFMLLVSFYNPWKPVSRGYRKSPVAWNGLLSLDLFSEILNFLAISVGSILDQTFLLHAMEVSDCLNSNWDIFRSVCFPLCH